MEESKGRISRHSLITRAKQQGKAYMISLVTRKGQTEDPEEVEMVRQQFRDVLNVNDLSKVTLNELSDVLDPMSALERLDYRRGSSNTSVVAVRPFGTIKEICEKSAPTNIMPIVSFKNQRYAASMNAHNITVTVQKNSNEVYSFCVATQDPANLFPTSYDPIREFVTMEANEFEREI